MEYDAKIPPQIKELSILLEALQPLPGLDANRFLGVLKSSDKSKIIDYRDSKIVHLAKKCRNLSLALESTKTKYEKLREESQGKSSCSNGNSRQEEKVSASRSSTTSRPATCSKAVDESAEKIQREAKQQLAFLQKQNTELKLKLECSQSENKKLQRALTKEVGEGAPSNNEGVGGISMEKVSS